jgi:hypothetical protein
MKKTIVIDRAYAKDKLTDKLWRLNNLYYIKTKEKRLVPLKLNKAQRDYFTRRGLRNYILKARQLGFSTACLIDLLDDAIFVPNTNAAIIAHEKVKVVQLFEIVQRAFSNLPPGLKPRVSLENRNELYFPDIDSKIYVALDTRSGTVHNLHVSELAFIRNAEQMMAGTLESVPKEGKITYETTANGMSNYAFDEWVDANSEFGKFFFNWMWDDDYQQPTKKTLEQLHEEYRPLAVRYKLIEDIYERFELTIEQYNWYISKAKRHKELVVQEYPTTAMEAFISSGKGVFHASDLAKHIVLEPIERKWTDCLIWEKPLTGFYYTVGVDSSEGVGGDNAVIEVLNVNTGVQAAEFATPNLPPDQLATYVLDIAKWYNRALIVPEINSSGISLVDHIKLKYVNIYRRKVFDKISGMTQEAIGWRTTGTTKPILIHDLEEATREQYILINSEAALKEMRTFVRTDESGKQGFGAEGSNHDDRVIALGLAYQGAKQMPRKAKAPESVAQRKLREFIEKKKLETYFPPGSSPSLVQRQRQRYSIRGVNP